MKKSAKVAPNPHLKRARERQGWSQEYVAREVGTDAFTISRWERGVTMPSPHFRQKLCALFGLSVAELGLLPAGSAESTEQEQVSGVREAREPNESIVQSSIIQTPIFDSIIPPPLAREHSLIGRDEMLDDLKRRLLGTNIAPLLALNGLPGVGKTALATALAHDDDVRAYFSDGVLWVGLGYEPDVLGLLSRWGTVLHCAPPDLAQRSRPQAWAASIHEAIGQRRMLLVIDDAWQIADALAFQVGGPNCAHLVTTRFPEIARRFAAQDAIVIRELEDIDGRRLLMRLAPEVVQVEPKEAQALVEAVGGLPLALTLLGNFLRAQAHSGQPRRLRAALERLRHADERLRLNEPQPLVGGHPGLSAGAPLSLQAVIGISDQQVSEEARSALRALAVFSPKPDTFTEQAAVAVSNLPVEMLDELTDAGLLESSGPERYTMHQTIADYARVQLIDTGAIERFVTYFVTYMEAHATDYAALDSENSNILSALEAAFERAMHTALVRGVHAFAPLLITRGLYTVAETQFHCSLDAARTLGDVAGQATARFHLGKIAEQRGDYAQAQTYWQDSLALARAGGQHGSAAQTLHALGDLAWKRGQLPQARQFLMESLDILRQLEDRRGIADTLKNLGNVAAEQGQPVQSHQLYGEALAIFRELGDQRGIAVVLHNLGIRTRELGQPEQARRLYEEALAIFRHLGDRHSSAVALSNLGNLARHQGQPEQARQYLQESMTILHQLGNRRSFAFALLNLGSVAVDQGQFELAYQQLNEALTTFRAIHALRDAAITLQGLGALMRKQEKFSQAHQYLAEALTIFQDLKDQRQQAITLREQGVLAREQGEQGEQGRREEAHRLFAEALAMLTPLEDRREVTITHLELAILLRRQNHLDEAQQLLTTVLTTMRQIKDRHYVAFALNEWSLLMQQRGQLEEALRTLLMAGVGLTLMNTPDIADLKAKLSQLHAQTGEDIFLSIAARVASETPEPAYAVDQAAWAAAVRKLAKQAPLRAKT